jgi:nucleoside-diphosphate kinase
VRLDALGLSLASFEVLNAMQVWEGQGVVASGRKLVGSTNPLQAEPGTIRGDFAIVTGRNIVHASDSPENGTREAGD